MTKKSGYHVPYIAPRLKKFFNENCLVIDAIIKRLKKYKPRLVDAYKYSSKNPSPNPRYKYPERLFIACIYYIIKHGSSWDSFIGPIPGNQLNKRHNEYLRYDLYSNFFNDSLKKYLKTHKLKHLNMDSSFLNNKNCTELKKRQPINKNRKAVKLTVIADDSGSPLTCSIAESTENDCKSGNQEILKLADNKIIIDAINKADKYIYTMADSGFDSSFIKSNLKKIGLRHIIYPSGGRRGNKSNLKNVGDKSNLKNAAKNNNNKKRRRKKLPRRYRKRYKKRIKIEHLFAIIKRYPKINCVYEKKIKSFYGLVMFLLGGILINRSIA